MSSSQLEHDNELIVLMNFRGKLTQILKGVLELSGRETELIQKGKAGGFYQLFCQNRGWPIATLMLGDNMLSLESARNRYEFVGEKNIRLFGHPEHLASRETRDPDNDHYAGAVRGIDYLHSFSGLPEDDDEIFSTFAAVFFGDMRLQTAKQILGEERYLRYVPIVTRVQLLAA